MLSGEGENSYHFTYDADINANKMINLLRFIALQNTVFMYIKYDVFISYLVPTLNTSDRLLLR